MIQMKKPRTISKTFTTENSLYKPLQNYLGQKAKEINDNHSDYRAALTSARYSVDVAAPTYPDSIRNDLQFIVVKKLSNRAKPSHTTYFKILISQKLVFKEGYNYTTHLWARILRYKRRKQALSEADLNLYKDLVADISDFVKSNTEINDAKH